MSVDALTTQTQPVTIPDGVPDNWVFKPRFPSGELLDFIRDFLPAQPAWGSAQGSGAVDVDELADVDGPEGPRYRLWYAPGGIGIQRKNLARHERTGERQQLAHGKLVDLHVAIHTANHLKHGTKPDACDGTCPHWPQEPAPRQEITEWSKKSHANMWLATHQIDYETDKVGQRWMRRGVAPVMVTLTYPGDWYAVAPTGRASKRHFRMFIRRWRRAWGSKLTGLWKLEFQERGAPHYHILTLPQRGVARAGRYAGLRFKEWVSRTWADCVGARGEEWERHLRAGTGIDPAKGRTMTDPRKVAVYFSKHSAFTAKWYQNLVPVEWQGPGRGPGRFWGYLNLRRSVRAVELSPDDAQAVIRVLRKWAKSQGVTRSVKVGRTAGGRPQLANAAAVVGLAGAQYADHRPRLTRDRDGRLVWVDQPARPPITYRRVRRRAQRMRGGAGWVSVNSGAVFASMVADFLNARYQQQRADLLAQDDIARRPTDDERELLATTRSRWRYRPPQ